MNILKSNLSKFFIFPGVRFYLAIVVVCLVASAGLGFMTPKLMQKLPQDYASADLFNRDLVYLSILFISVYLVRVLYQLVLNKYVQLMIQNVRTMIYQKWILNYEAQIDDPSGSERYPQGEVIARIMSDTLSLRELMTSGTFGILIDICFVLSCLVSFFIINRFTGAFLCMAEIIVAILLVWGGKQMRVIFHKVRRARGMVSQSVANVVGGVSDSYYTKHNNYASKSGSIVFADFLQKQLTANIWDAAYYSLAESLYPIFLVMVVYIFPYSQIIDAAVIFVIIDLIQRSISPIKSIAGKIANIQRAVTGIQRINEFTSDLDQGFSAPVLEWNNRSNRIEFFSIDVKIKFFQYTKTVLSSDSSHKKIEPFSLQEINLSGKKGELLGIVGSSGCGKSTLLSIIAGNIIAPDAHISLQDTQGQKFFFPGRTKQEMFSYKEQVGIVSQDSHIFSESLEFNITLQQETPDSFNKFWTWIKDQIPYLENWNITLADTISPPSLSVGQGQLISAIRACYLRKSVVLFDEISSSLDGDLELALRKAVLLLQKTSLTIVVAHRLETVIDADRLIVMQDGRIISEGRHHNLLEHCEVYKHFIKELSHL